MENPEVTVNTSELENPVLPSIYELNDFGTNIKKIQDTALKVVKLQETAKERGELTDSEETLYKESMDILSQSAQNLAHLQEELHPLDFEGREGLSSWLDRRLTKDKNKKKDEDKRKKEEEKKKKEEEEKKKKEEEEKKKKDEEEKKKKEEEKKKKAEEKRKEEEKKEEEKRKEEEMEKEGEKEEGEDDDAIEINLPREDASVAEAKPVGLAVAGKEILFV